jgi:hypothetical protein
MYILISLFKKFSRESLKKITLLRKFKENYLFGEFDEMCSPLLDPLRIILANFPPEIIAKIFYPTCILQYETFF